MKKLYADVVIVGTGVAGALCAYKLAKKGIKVIALDAGPRIARHDVVSKFQSTHKIDLSAGYPNEDYAPRPDWGQPGDDYIHFTGPDRLQAEYLRVVGGTTWHWSAACIRFLPHDFKMKTTYGIADDWPITYQEIEPYYTQAEYEMGVSGHDSAASNNDLRSKPYPMEAIPHSFMENQIMEPLEKKSEFRFDSKPVARNSRQYKGRSRCKGFGTCSPICPSGAQYSAMVHVEKAEKHGAQILSDMLVDKIIKNKDGIITSVKGRHKAQQPFEAFGKVIVVAANGIETPKLLLMSANESEPTGLANNSGQVGRNLMDHPMRTCRFLMPKPVYAGRGPQSQIICETYRDHPERNYKAAWMMSPNNFLPLYNITLSLLKQGMVGEKLNNAIQDQSIRMAQISMSTEQLPNPQNSISLDFNKKDRSGQPQILLHCRFGDYEKKALSAMEITFQRILKILQAEMITISSPFSQSHLMGTARMGKDPKAFVTDKDGRTHDHKNLFIAGSALFTTGGTANPTLTIAALALRTTDKIIQELSKLPNR